MNCCRLEACFQRKLTVWYREIVTGICSERLNDREMKKEIEFAYWQLDLEPGAELSEVKESYRDLVRVWHPDRFTNNPRLRQRAEEKMKRINTAYHLLLELLARDQEDADAAESSEKGKNVYRDGLKRIRYPSGKVKSEFHVKNGQVDGVARSWHENGQLASEVHYEKGKRCGPARFYYENGQLHSQF
ncbi:MAG: hypothetical protein D6820_18145 [Lentisphaerae bacterium]|nr:MAG: hypothetical protein D6820_18145 [Lentisphaerota bacterium]